MRRLIENIRLASKMGGRNGLILTTRGGYFDEELVAAGVEHVSNRAGGRYTGFNHHGDKFYVRFVNPMRNYMGAVAGLEFDFLIVESHFSRGLFTQAHGFLGLDNRIVADSALGQCLRYCVSRVRHLNDMDKHLNYPPLPEGKNGHCRIY